MEHGTDVLHRSHSFSDWSSFEAEDVMFGAKLIEGKTQQAKHLSGKSVFMIFHRFWDEKKSTNKFWEDLVQQTSTKEPTRILVVAPSQYVDPFLDTKHRGVLELARLKNPTQEARLL